MFDKALTYDRFKSATMFSGLKYIFGLSDDTEANPQPSAGEPSGSSASNTEHAGASPSSSSEKQKALGSASGALLEKTLNAATTKLSEQLLPPQASIEQLQLSSHQLLPCILEQPEQSKASALKEAASISVAAQNDDDCLEVDSWELLDFVEKPECKDEILSVQDSIVNKESPSEALKPSTSGILKTNFKAPISMENSAQQTRQKPKVSFETHDLVNCLSNTGTNKIEQNDGQHIVLLRASEGVECGGEQENSVQSSSQRCLAVGVGKKFGNDSRKKSSSKGRKRSGKLEDTSDIRQAKIPSKSTGQTELVREKVSPSSYAAPKNVLNYAAALAKKAPVSASDEGSVAQAQAGSSAEFKPPGCSMKRNRTQSTSSWSSNEDLSSKTPEAQASTAREETPAPNIEDNESMVSSGFSDCDFRYEDYYLRPKKGHSKRGRNLFAPGPLSRRCSRTMRSSIKVTVQGEQKSSDVGQCGRSLRPLGVKISTRQAKQKGNNAAQTSGSWSLPKKAQLLTADKIDDQSPSNGSGSNDSSEVADMDESWYVTPPPCFTGASKSTARKPELKDLPKSKESARENELIENPSIPVSSKLRANASAPKLGSNPSSSPEGRKISASSSRKVVDPAWDMDDDDDCFDMDDADWMPATRHLGSKKNKIQAKSPTTSTERVDMESSIIEPVVVAKNAGKSVAKKSTSSPLEKSRNASWVNKFGVADWGLDDQEDPESDFDDMFVQVKKKKASAKTKAQRKAALPQKTQTVHLVDQDQDPDSELSVITPSCSIEVPDDASGGAELLSIRSSRSFDSPIDDAASTSGDDLGNNKENDVNKTLEKRSPKQVSQIKPERPPSWQLKRKRSKRRSLSSSTSATAAKQRVGAPRGQPESRSVSSQSSSARSTPTLIDRIGSSIVANISNLTSGLVSSGALHSAPVGSPVEESPRSNQAAQAIVRQTLVSDTCNFEARKRMSKSYLNRQNTCAHKANSQRRPGRQSKMFATQNGCSINRKVQSNFH